MSQTLKVKLNLPDAAYTIYIGDNFNAELRLLRKSLPSPRAFIIADVSLKAARRHLIRLLEKSGYEVREIAVRAGENLKDFKNSFSIYGDLLTAGAHRDSVIFALGGGSIGDAAGFIASTYLRGIAWVGVPTTLLAQVDSAIGGKTAVNHPQGKNLIGTFHQPRAVFCDVTYLKTLSSREIISGLGEALKYGLTYDPNFFKFIQKNWAGALRLDEKVLTQVIHRCVKFKAAAVAKDEFDKKGIREVLNFGHTMAHALETATDYKVFQHGEAVIWGMRFALALSVERGWLAPSKRHQIEGFLAKLKLRPWPQKIRFEKLVALLSKDKKMRAGKLHYVLIRDLGKPVSDPNVTHADLYKAYDLLVAEAAI